MHFLKPERTTLAAFFPSLDDALAKLPLLTMESHGNPALPLFREAGGPGLLIPTQQAGLGATPLQAVRVQRALGSRSPSLAVAATMHHFSVATLVEMAASESGSGLEWMVLEGIARQKLWVASGFAEGRTGASILSSHMEVIRTDEGLVISGSKKPCSLSASMDLLTASVMVSADAGRPAGLAVVMIPASTPGIERRPFWASPVLAGAESDEVVLRDVVVPENLIAYGASPGQMDAVQERSFLWFELLISASYLGVASALVERVLVLAKGTPAERVRLAIEVEGAMAALEGVARGMTAPVGPWSPDRGRGQETAAQRGEGETGLLAQALFVRYAVQNAVERAAAHAAELLGGMAFVGSPDIAYLVAAARALAFHPPSRLSASAALDGYLAGGPLKIE